MASSIIDSLTGFISPQLVDSLASHLGESSAAVETGLRAEPLPCWGDREPRRRQWLS